MRARLFAAALYKSVALGYSYAALFFYKARVTVQFAEQPFYVGIEFYFSDYRTRTFFLVEFVVVLYLSYGYLSLYKDVYPVQSAAQLVYGTADLEAGGNVCVYE